MNRPIRYPYRPERRLVPTWTSGRSRAIALACFLCLAIALLVRAPLSLAESDDLALRIGLPCLAAFVLAFAPRPATVVGALAVDLTIAGLLAAALAGHDALLMLLGYPLLLAGAVVLGTVLRPGRTDRARPRSRREPP